MSDPLGGPSGKRVRMDALAETATFTDVNDLCRRAALPAAVAPGAPSTRPRAPGQAYAPMPPPCHRPATMSPAEWVSIVLPPERELPTAAADAHAPSITTTVATPVSMPFEDPRRLREVRAQRWENLNLNLAQEKERRQAEQRPKGKQRISAVSDPSRRFAAQDSDGDEDGKEAPLQGAHSEMSDAALYAFDLEGVCAAYATRHGSDSVVGGPGRQSHHGGGSTSTQSSAQPPASLFEEDEEVVEIPPEQWAIHGVPDGFDGGNSGDCGSIETEALVAAFVADANSEPNCQPIGSPRFTTLLAGLQACSELARTHRPAGPDRAAVLAGVDKAKELVQMGYRVEKNPMGSHGLPDASQWSFITSWPLGEQMEMTGDLADVGTSGFPVQKAPYVCDPDGSTVPTFHTAMLTSALLAPDPSKPPFTTVHLNDVSYATVYAENVQVGTGSRPSTFKEPPNTNSIARACASASVLPTLVSREKPGAIAQGDSQLPALLQLVKDGSALAVLHAGPAVYKLFGKSVAECEMTPGHVKHLFGLKLVQMPDDTCKLFGIVVSSPKLKGPNAQPAAAVQTTMGVINVLRVLSGLAEIPVASSPLWGRTCRASHDELARLRALMPRLAEAFKADTSGGRATIASHGEQMGNGGRKSSTRFP